MKLLHILSGSVIQIGLPNIHQLSNLERLVINKAIKTSFLSTINSEWSLSDMIMDAFNGQNDSMWIMSTILIFSYGYYKSYRNIDQKLQTIEIYNTWNKNIQEILFIIFIVLTKNVENAS